MDYLKNLKSQLTSEIIKDIEESPYPEEIAQSVWFIIHIRSPHILDNHVFTEYWNKDYHGHSIKSCLLNNDTQSLQILLDQLHLITCQRIDAHREKQNVHLSIVLPFPDA